MDLTHANVYLLCFLLIPYIGCPTAEPSCTTVTVTATHTVSYALPAPLCSTTHTVSYALPAPSCSTTHTVSYTPIAAPSCSTTTTVIEYLSITPTNCPQSTHTKKMSTTEGTFTTDTATGQDSNSNLVILGAFIAVLAALLVAVTTGWIVTCVVNKRKEKASTTRY